MNPARLEYALSGHNRYRGGLVTQKVEKDKENGDCGKSLKIIQGLKGLFLIRFLDPL
jgi:hypothetical protein